MQNLKAASYMLGSMTEKTKQNAMELAAKNDLAGKVDSLKQSAINNYEVKTGRSAAVDGTILKYSAVATATAVGISTLPAVMVASAVGATVYAGVAANASEIDKKVSHNYTVVTGRDAAKDKGAVFNFANDVGKAGSECAASFKEGAQAAKSQAPQPAV